VTVTWADGRAGFETVRVAKGSPARPLTADERLEKVRACASALLADRFDAFVDLAGRLEALTDVRELTRLLGHVA
jgi:hypothetical protein